MNKRKTTKKLLLVAGLISMAVAIAAEVLLFSLRYPKLWAWWEDTQQLLYKLEDKIFTLDKNWQFFFVIMGLYIIKSIIPIYTTSTVCFITGAVLPIYLAIPINMLGTAIQISIKYFIGKKFGAGNAWKLIRKNDFLRSAVQSGGTGNPVVLVSMRLVPCMPINLISAIYGSLNFNYGRYMVLSLVGSLPRIISFTFVGRNMFDPLSAKFLLPVMIIAFLTAISCLSVNGAWTATDKVINYLIKFKKRKRMKGTPDMINNSVFREKITEGKFDASLSALYKASDLNAQKQRYLRVSMEFDEIFGEGNEVCAFSAPGRSEICGNHTDHNHGKVLAASVDLDAIAIASYTEDNTVRIKSEGFNMDTVSLDELEIKSVESGHSASLVRGICAAFKERGYNIGGFCAATASDVKSGSGLSSSAAFEVLVGTMLNHLYNGGKITPVEIAQISQYAENKYFGKPCGLMDQMACSVGGFIKIDFKDPENPVIGRINFDFATCGHSLCIIDSGADHSDLTDEYAAVREEMEAVASVFGKKVLRDVDRSEFENNLAKVREKTNDRAILRAKHFYNENDRVEKQAVALASGDFEAFKSLIIESGFSSFMYNQNVFTCKYPTQQAVALALAICDDELKGKGAWRVHGGGFAGTIQAFVPNDMLDKFKAKICSVYGENACYVLNIRPAGGVVVTGEK